MSGSWIEEVIAYGRSRFQVRLYLPLALFISLAGQVGHQHLKPENFIVASIQAFALLFQFRLWDDLCDRDQDRIDHPERLLSKTVSIKPFLGLLIVAWLFNFILVLLLFVPGDQAVVFILLNGAFLLWYRWLRGYCVSRITGYHVILMKYPAFVYLVNRDPSEAVGLHLFLSMVLVYFCFCIYEPLHDERLRLMKPTINILALEMFALCLIFGFMAFAVVGRGGLAVLLQGMLAVTGALVLATLFNRHRTRLDLKGWRYSVFVISFLQVLWFSLSGSY